MYNFILQAHSGWRYVVLIALIVTIVKFLVGWLTSSKWSNFDTTLNRVTPIVIDVQWLLGIIVWIVGSWWQNSNATLAWEHPVLMTVAVLVVHFFVVRARKADSDRSRYATSLLGYLVGALIIAYGISRAVGGWNLFAM